MDRDIPAPIIAGRYRLLEEIGRGNIGRVFRVEHVHTGESFALKVLVAHRGADPTIVERFKREARTPALIKSDHVVKVIDADVAVELDGAPFLVMELLVGVDLEAYLNERGRLPAGEAVAILTQVARALDRAHAIGVVHRDLKPANIFLHQREGEVVVKVLDFGISKLGVNAPSEIAITASGQIMGTPLYMPPEQALGKTNVGPAADVWAIGMLAFKLLTGKAYWSLGTMAELMAAIVRDPISAPSARERLLSSAFDAWFTRSCEKTPTERWSTAGEQVRELAAALGVAMPEAATLQSAELPFMAMQTLKSPRHAGGEGARGRGEQVSPSRPRPGFSAPADARPAPAEPSVGNAAAGDKQEKIAAPPRSLDGERRQVTVLSCELSVTSLEGDEVDPEDLRDVTSEYHAACAAVLGKMGGPVTQTMGDGLVVYFGYPIALGDDAKRAVTAALEVARACEGINERASKARRVSVSMRAGVHTGLVVTADSIREPDPKHVVGQVPQVASRLKRAAPPNGVAISSATHRLVRTSFLCETLPGAEASGASEGKLDLYRVVGPLDPAMEESQGSRVLIGRDSEIGLLVDRWEQAKAGQGQFALVMGEAGLGKSRLVRALRETLHKDPDATWLECKTSPYFDNTQLHPVIELLGRIAQIEREDPVPARLAKVRRMVDKNAAPPETFALLAALLDLPVSDDAALRGLSPQLQKQRTHEAIVSLLHAMGRRSPVILVIEDLHWADPSTLDLLALLVDQSANSQVFALLTARPGFSPAWATRGYVTRLNLTRLTPKRVEALILAITGGKALPANVVADLIQKTDGVPLFVEELTKNMLEAGELEDTGARFEQKANSTLNLSIPGTLRDSLMARLDRLGPAKSTAQLGATIGREFDFEVLSATSSLDAAELAQHLRTLVDSELVHQRGSLPEVRYTFKHALVQEAAYESLTRNARKQIHARVAAVLVARKPELAECEPEVLAHHYAAAGQAFEAAGCLLQAGRRALGRSANAEAIAHFTRALDLLGTAPDSVPRDRLEATIRTLIGVPLMATRGYGAPEVEKTYARALGLKGLQGSQEMLPVLWGLWIFYHVRGKYETALQIAEQMIQLVEVPALGAARAGMKPRERGPMVIAHLARGCTSLLLGKLDAARGHLERTMQLYDTVHHRDHAFAYGQDSSMFAGTMLSWTLWLQGYPDNALTTAQESIRHAKTLDHANSIGFAIGMTAALHQYRGDVRAAREMANEGVAFCGEQGLPHWLALARIIRGWAQVQDGDGNVQLGLADMLEGRATWRAIGARVADSHWDCMIAETLIGAGRLDEAREVLVATHAFVEESGESSFDAEIRRLEGELALAKGDQSLAEARFREAIALAETGAARSLELRAATSLARLLLDTNRAEAARNALGPVFYGFAEGHSTADVEKAQRTLDRANP